MSSLVLLSLVVTAATTVPNVAVNAFSPPPTIATYPTTTIATSSNNNYNRHPPTLFSTTTDTSPPPAAEIDDDDQLTPGGLLRRDRYVATNRFAVRPNKEAAFEKRWATRKSRLATLDGFQYFHLMRRVTLDDDDGSTNTYQPGNAKEKTNLGNYVSFTIWNKKSHFSAWRSGEAFKEAHGGTSIGAFVSTLVSSALVLQGAPRPAFYDGLLLQSIKPESIPELEDGWRSNVEADGKVTLPPECFVACNQFYVDGGTENCVAFEKRWAERESKLKECDGFVAFMMMRRDLGAKGHGIVPAGSDEPTYVSTTIWRDREAFEGWRSSNNFKQAHGGEKKKAEGKDDGGGGEKPKMPWSRPPQPVFYEGTLVITSEDGA